MYIRTAFNNVVKVRCFIAIPCPEDIREKLVEVQNHITDYGKIKLVEKNNIHLTLKFLGEVPEDKTKKISEELNFLNERKKFEVKVKGIGVFPNPNRINVVWAGLEDGSKVIELQKRVDEKLNKDFPPEKKFHPHYTIARVKYVRDKEALKKQIIDHQETEFGSYTIQSVKLMASRLTPKGPVYSTLGEYTLG